MLNENANRTENIIEEDKKMFESRIPAGATENYLGARTSRKNSRLVVMTWKVMRRSAWKDIGKCQIGRLKSCTTSLLHAWTTITSPPNSKLFKNLHTKDINF